ncbi:alpha-tocopherol transfer protein-like [Euwallacea similis]|uniref:alpha-tocopherol transfer protein-like n=1 Tax=Euwallacea similis TaxID=1736056 RepID=UPI00344E5413
MIMPICVETDEKGSPFVTLGTYQLRLELEDISGEFEDKARTELLETPERLREGLEKLKELIRNEKGLSLPIDDDTFLTKFLRPFRCNAEHSFKIMRKFYKFKLKNPKYGGQTVTPAGVRHVFDSEVFMFLPTRSKFGGRIMIINAGSKWKPKQVTIEHMFKSIMVAIEIAMMEPKTQVGGVNVILNMEGLAMSHVCQFSPSVAKLIVEWVQECAPIRLRGLHIVNQPYLFNMLFALFKPFLGEYLKKMLFFHGKDFKSLCDKIGPESLPLHFGGNAKFPEYPGSIFSDMLFYYDHEFKVHQTYGYFTESKEHDLMASHNEKNTVFNICGQPG